MDRSQRAQNYSLQGSSSAADTMVMDRQTGASPAVAERIADIAAIETGEGPRCPNVLARRPIRVAAWMAILVLVAFSTKPVAAADWNEDAIRWRPWPEALEEAKQTRMPICLVFYANWCVHCRHYSRVFHAPSIVEASKRFVMVRLDQDENPHLSRTLAIDGEYVPRTYFFSPDGTLEPRIHARRAQSRYFYDEDDPASLLTAMRVASRSSAPPAAARK